MITRAIATTERASLAVGCFWGVQCLCLVSPVTGPNQCRQMPWSTGVCRGGVPLDELVGDHVEVLAGVVRLRADGEGGVALTQDERGLPAGRRGADRVPDMGRDQADVAGVDLERGGHEVVGLRGWLVAFDGLVDTEPALE